MKEFTVYPKREKTSYREDDVLLVLKEDGSFQQYTSLSVNDYVDDDDEEEATNNEDIDQAWSKFTDLQRRKQKMRQKKQKIQEQFAVPLLDELKGVWDIIDGKLILAADRPGLSTVSPPDKQTTNRKDAFQSSQDAAVDTMLVGRVVATYGTSLQDNPVLAASSTNEREQHGDSSKKNDDPKESAGNRNNKSGKRVALDTHLSVPKGSVQVGRFFYPRNHPSFFEQPMFQPVRRGGFRLRQVLGALNSQNLRDDETELIEKYRKSDFYNKTFLLSSHPIVPKTKPSKNKQSPLSSSEQEPWSPKSYRQSLQQQNQPSDTASPGIPIRVMQLQFHANNTFSTIAGLGDNTVLRGKFDVIGQDRDQLWMQIWRFGFGRSVSGSVFSEGRHLTHEDAKTYWGTIQPESNLGKISKMNGTAMSQTPMNATAMEMPDEDNRNDDSSDTREGSRFEVKGSVLVGWGLEPLPVARFLMREVVQKDDDTLLQEEEEEDGEEDDAVGGLDEALKKDNIADHGINWSKDSSEEAFQ